LIGFFQAAAVFPGLSRSGATITGGMLRNLTRPAAARFSFLLSVPIMLAAGLLAVNDLMALQNTTQSLLVFIPGFIAAGITGYLCIRWLLAFLAHRTLYIFAIYCVAVSILILLVSVYRG
jgi:undecaprenyl-diphosphatase